MSSEEKKNYQKLIKKLSSCSIFFYLIQKMKELHYNVYENWHMILKITAITIDVL